MTAAPVHLYCYYRVDPAHGPAAREAIAHLFRVVEDRLGIVARLYRGEREPWLWMEVYENVREADRLEKLLAEQCAALDLRALLVGAGERRIERFVAAGS